MRASVAPHRAREETRRLYGKGKGKRCVQRVMQRTLQCSPTVFSERGVNREGEVWPAGGGKSDWSGRRHAFAWLRFSVAEERGLEVISQTGAEDDVKHLQA